MTTNGRPVTEDDLHAYVDGRLDAARLADIERYLNDHPEAAARVRGWRHSGELLRAALQWKGEEALPPGLGIRHLAEGRLARRASSWRMAAGIAVGLMAGAAGGWMARGPNPSAGIVALGLEAAATRQALAADPIGWPEQTSAGSALLARYTAQTLGHAATPPDLQAAGYALVGGQPVTTVHGVACAFLYQNQRGERILLMIRPMQERDLNASMRPVEADNAAGYAWARHGLGFSLVSAAGNLSLHALSNRVRDALQEGV